MKSVTAITALAVIVLIACGVTRAAEEKPNIIFFLVDDLGQRDIGCYGSEFHETPSIDQLAKEGMLFTNAYATCHVCSPSRASILTGKYPARTNLTEWLGGRPERDYEPLHHAEKLTALPDEEVTLAETLKSHGYATANYGKAHVRMDPKTYGFDEEITGWVKSYHYPFGGAYNEKLPAKKGDYYTDKLTDAALDFIERNQDQPFFVHLEHFAVHDPIQGRPDLVEKYRKKLAAMPEQEGPDFILEPNPDGPPLTKEELKALAENNERQAQQDARVWWVKQKQDNVEFAGMLEATDESLARIRAKLKELGLEESTIIVFTSDNGGMSASNGYSANASREALDSRFASSNLPLRGAKGWNYEGGIRVPLIVHWPGRTEPNSTSEAVVTGTDYYPTLLEMMNLPAVPDQHVDGKSFVPALNGDAYKRGPVYWHFPHYSNHGYQSPGGAIRSGDFKLLEYYENGTVQLFDLANDIGERNDLAAERPEMVAKLKKQFEDWRDEVDAKMPYPKTATSKPAPGARVKAPPAKGKGSGAVIVSEDLPKQVEQFAPGWKVKDWGGPGMKPGLRKEWGGRKSVLLTHPLSRDTPCVLSRSVDIPTGKKTALTFAVNNHPKGNWTLVVRIDGDEVLQKSIEASSWQEFQFDLTKHAGKTIKIELENRASDWAFEAAYWSRIELVDLTNHVKALADPAYQLDLIVQANQKLKMQVESRDVVHADICVYGGTPGGITAAISAAREGASVILLEQTRHVGGLTTSGLNRDECNHLDRQTLGGLCEQFLEEAVKRSNGRWTEGNSRTWQSGIAERVFLEMLKKAGVEVRYEQLLDQVAKDGTRITELGVQGGEIYRAKVFIDATYEGDLMAKAGVSYSVGRESAEQYGESIAGVRYLDDKVAISPFDDEGNLLFGVMPGKPPVAGSASEVPICYNVRLNITTDEANRVPIEKPSSYDPMQHELLARALEAGLLKNLTSIIGIYPMGESSKRELNNRQFSIVSMSIPGAQTSWAEASFEEREAIHQKYRDYTHGMLWFLKTDPRVPERIRDEMAPYGFCKDEWADNNHWPYYLYIRAARRMQGEIILTEADVIEDVDKKDVIHVGSHFIDCHHAARYVSDSGHIINEGRIWKIGARFDIPYRAITPKAGECTNLLVPVCASASHVAFCTIRLEPTWMHLGEAAGIAAVMAGKSGKSVQAVDVKSLQARLLELGIPLDHPAGPMAYEKKHGKPRTFAPDDVVKEFFAIADKDGDGMASRSEWNAARPTWEWLFDHMDKDKNGQLDRAEYKAWQTYKKEHPDWHKSLRDNLNQGGVKQPN